MKLGLVFIALIALILAFCGVGREHITEKNFIGKWKSSRAETPIYLYENGEWEIKKADGVILQYGVWQYKPSKIIWSYKVDGATGHDVNAVLSATSREFQLRERNGMTTTFKRIE
ncbi:MAG: hypothetical protein WC696_08885 [Candidatus Methylopumilus sp.]|jgi:hypothetical protein